MDGACSMYGEKIIAYKVLVVKTWRHEMEG